MEWAMFVFIVPRALGTVLVENRFHAICVFLKFGAWRPSCIKRSIFIFARTALVQNRDKHSRLD